MAASALHEGEVHKAFYILEFEKNRMFSGVLRSQSTRHGRLSLEGREPVLASSSRGNRGLKLVVDSEARRVVDLDEAYWKDVEATELRAWLVERRKFGSLAGGDYHAFPWEAAMRSDFLLSTLEEAQFAIPGDTLLLSYAVLGEEVVAFALGGGEAEIHRLAMSRDRLVSTVRALIEGVRDPKTSRWERAARELDAVLLQPFAERLSTVDSLIVVPHSVLSAMPFGVLLDDTGSSLLSRVELTYLPSVSYYRHLAKRELEPAPPKVLAMGNALYPRPFAPLPAAEREVQAVSRIYPASRALIGREATETAFHDAHSRFNVLHFATHGVLGGRGRGPASSLLLTADSENDGFLAAWEIGRLDLSTTQMVVLSACETSVGASGANNDLDSLAAAFLGAGAPNVIGSQWPVSDEATARLMVELYGRFAQLGVTQALRSSQLGISQMKEYAHPYYWAPFVNYGSGT